MSESDEGVSLALTRQKAGVVLNAAGRVRVGRRQEA